MADNEWTCSRCGVLAQEGEHCECGQPPSILAERLAKQADPCHCGHARMMHGDVIGDGGCRQDKCRCVHYDASEKPKCEGFCEGVPCNGVKCPPSDRERNAYAQGAADQAKALASGQAEANPGAAWTDAVADNESTGLLALVCPYCGATLRINTESVGHTYMTYDQTESIECYAGDCEATWEADGVPRDAPKWERYPDVYAEPQRAAERRKRHQPPASAAKRWPATDACSDHCRSWLHSGDCDCADRPGDLTPIPHTGRGSDD